MTVFNYFLIMTITLIFIVLVLRACFYLFITKQDPIKSIIPNVAWKMLFRQEQLKKVSSVIKENS